MVGDTTQRRARSLVRRVRQRFLECVENSRPGLVAQQYVFGFGESAHQRGADDGMGRGAVDTKPREFRDEDGGIERENCTSHRRTVRWEQVLW